jgi:glycopeptide antibiotics resistance protein
MNFVDICLAVDDFVYIAIYFAYCVPKWNTSAFSVFVKTVFYVYGFFVLFFTCLIPVFIPIPFINVNISNIHANFVPFIDYLNSAGDFVRQILLNVLILVPFGIMYPFIYKRNLHKTVFAGFLVSLSIEILQLFYVRQFSSCDITDIITNVLGVLAGFMIYKCFGTPLYRLLNKLFSDKHLKRYTISKGVKTILIALIVMQLIIRSLLIAFI